MKVPLLTVLAVFVLTGCLVVGREADVKVIKGRKTQVPATTSALPTVYPRPTVPVASLDSLGPSSTADILVPVPTSDVIEGNVRAREVIPSIGVAYGLPSDSVCEVQVPDLPIDDLTVFEFEAAHEVPLKTVTVLDHGFVAYAELVKLRITQVAMAEATPPPEQQAMLDYLDECIASAR